MNNNLEQLHYSMVIEWDPRDDIFVVTIPELPGCRTHGVTYEEAVRMGKEAVAGWIDAARAWNDPVPPPRLFTDRMHDQASPHAARMAR